MPEMLAKRQWGAGRVSLLWKPSDTLTVLFKTDVGVLDNGAYPADPYTDRFKVLPGTTTPNPFYTDLFHIANDSDQMAQDEYRPVVTEGRLCLRWRDQASNRHGLSRRQHPV